MHPALSRKFIEVFLRESGSKSSQLIVTTHEAHLLDLDLVRRDEIWFIEKTIAGNSRLYSLEEYKTRNDRDVRKGYLFGRFGGIPFFDDEKLKKTG